MTAINVILIVCLIPPIIAAFVELWFLIQRDVQEIQKDLS